MLRGTKDTGRDTLGEMLQVVGNMQTLIRGSNDSEVLLSQGSLQDEKGKDTTEYKKKQDAILNPGTSTLAIVS